VQDVVLVQILNVVAACLPQPCVSGVAGASVFLLDNGYVWAITFYDFRASIGGAIIDDNNLLNYSNPVRARIR
jgi:hypothetical protein